LAKKNLVDLENRKILVLVDKIESLNKKIKKENKKKLKIK